MYIDQPLQQPLQTVTAKLMDWAQNGLLILPNAVIAVLVVVLGWIAARIISTIVERLVGRFSPNSDVVRLLGFAAYVTLLAGGIFIALGVLHLDKTVTSLLTGVGILGLTLGFALQDVASNLMAGLLIELNHPFRLNDVIETNNFVGRVSRITLRDTQIAQLDGQIVVVPNKEIFNKPVVNHSSALQRRVDFEIKVPPDVDLDEALRLANQAVSGIDRRDKHREIELFFQSIDDTGTTLLVRFWIDSADEIEYLRARSAGIQRTKSAFDRRQQPQHA
ncbi:MAG TPA: mechanosensitive ion channel family protein [Vicinamibacterales bacterium]|nr:mechanosensitive ion channel family protein [Vicinamibacterales bacterium]